MPRGVFWCRWRYRWPRCRQCRQTRSPKPAAGSLAWMAPGRRAVTLHESEGGTLVVDDEYVGGLGALMSRSLCETLRQRMVEFGQGLKAAVEREVRLVGWK